MTRMTRRDFWTAAAASASTLGLAGSGRAAPAARNQMQVNIQATNLSARSLRYIKQMGIDNVYLHIPLVPGYAKTGYLVYDDLARVKKHVGEYGLSICGFHLNNLAKTNLLLGRPGWEKELDDICRTIECMGKGSVPVMLYNMLVSRVLADFTVRPLPGHSTVPSGRGGVGLKTYDDAQAQVPGDEPAGKITADEMWERLTRFVRKCVPVAESANVRLALHPDDPPVQQFWGATQVLNSLEGITRYLNILPSKANALDLCQGTFQEAGVDVIELIRTFGRQGKLAEVELRGVRGRIPHYEETFMDDGDLDLAKVVKTLKEVNYAGMVEVAHVPVIPGDADRFIANAWSIGYVKGLIAANQ